MKGEVVPILETAASNKKTTQRASGSAPVALQIDMKEAQALRKKIVDHVQTLQKLQKALKK